MLDGDHYYHVCHTQQSRHQGAMQTRTPCSKLENALRQAEFVTGEDVAIVDPATGIIEEVRGDIGNLQEVIARCREESTPAWTNGRITEA